jgi:hypothetical protein
MTALLAHLALGAAAGWLIWRISPPWLKGR